jgi:FAD binding domain
VPAVGGTDPRELTRDEIHAAIRRAVGVEFDYEILTVLPWVRRELVADRFRHGCGFILGDAAHAMSPTGGFGMNNGIGDAVDLSWKLAATLAGWGGSRLLDSYETERRPVGARNVAEASRNLRRMLSFGGNPTLLDASDEGARTRERVGREFSEAMRHEWYTLGIHLGYRYEGSPICWPDGTDAPPDHPRIYVPTARPGHRAPHAWLEHFPEKWEPVFREKMRPNVKPPDDRSTLDLFGRGFALLDLGAEASSVAALRDAARRGVPLDVVRIDEPSVLALYERRLVLVRPDGHVAWRDDRAPADPAALIDCVRGGVPAGAAGRRVAVSA